MNELNQQKDSIRNDKKSGKETNKMIKLNKGTIATLGLLGLLMVAYVGGTIYFWDRFFLNTQVNHIDFSGQKAVDAREFLERTADDFYLTIIGEDGFTENIHALDINLTFVASQEIEALLDAQNPFLWPLSLMNAQQINTQLEISFDEELFNELVSNLEVVTNGQTAPVSASVVIEGTDVTIEPHAYGNVVDVELLQAHLQENIRTLANEFNVLESDIFVQPAFKTDSPEIVDTYETANRYLSAAITYDVGREVIVDRELISEWMTIDEALNIQINEAQVTKWLNEFIGTVNTGAFEGYHPITAGAERTFRSHDGRDITVTGGYFGWIVNQEEEFATLLDNIRSGEVISREPIYSQRGITHGIHDWGDTFLQVDLTRQHMWAIIDGEVTFDAPIVTGRPTPLNTPQGPVPLNTPQGVFSILEMLSPTVLNAPWYNENGERIYELEVNYWMRTTWSGYGFHDAPWRRIEAFGGTYYRTGVGPDQGSHGCTNLSVANARTLYNMIYIGMPVVVHY